MEERCLTRVFKDSLGCFSQGTTRALFAHLDDLVYFKLATDGIQARNTLTQVDIGHMNSKKVPSDPVYVNIKRISV